MTSIRKRLSPEKADLLAALSNEDAAKLAKAIQEYKYAGAVPDEDNLTPLTTGIGIALKRKPFYPAPFTTGDPNNVFIIGDLHAPFIREGYLEWCREQQEKWNCGTVICIGDICDQHAISYHESDPDGMSAGQELDATTESLAKVFVMFPNVQSLLGNHDLLVARKARTVGLSQRHVRTIGEIYGAPSTWTFHHELEINGVLYTHGGIGGKADRICQQSRRSTVQGHFHMESYVHHYVSDRDAIWGMQVGAGQDDKAYAFAYGKPFPRKSAIGAGLVLDAGKTPLTLLMPL